MFSLMRLLTLIEVLELHHRVIEQSGGAVGFRDMGLLESAIAQPLHHHEPWRSHQVS
jgi:prophage maintenance system killer protein